MLNKSNFDVRANFTSDCSSYDKSDRIRERAAQAGQLGLLSLKDKRTKLDLIQTYKILKGIDTIDQNTWFSKVGFDATRLTRHTEYHDNLISKRSRSDVRQNFFSNPVVPKWNK